MCLDLHTTVTQTLCLTPGWKGILPCTLMPQCCALSAPENMVQNNNCMLEEAHYLSYSQRTFWFLGAIVIFWNNISYCQCLGCKSTSKEFGSLTVQSDRSWMEIIVMEHIGMCFSPDNKFGDCSLISWKVMKWKKTCAHVRIQLMWWGCEKEWQVSEYIRPDYSITDQLCQYHEGRKSKDFFRNIICRTTYLYSGNIELNAGRIY